MTLYIIRTRSKPYKFWRQRHCGTVADRKYAYHFTHKQVAAIAREFDPAPPADWFKTYCTVIPVEVS
ncbi:hypothetical protein vBAspALolek_25 [Aeromonas phage vB_AspA_Lolek]|nr:hypothetical protein vBAspALolek_25 [Aeromonas phage vB_AspA_Lolek]